MKLLSVAAVAARLNVSRRTVQRAIDDGRIDAHAVQGPGGELVAWVVEEEAVRGFVPASSGRPRKR